MTTQDKTKDINALIEKFDTMKKQEKMDLSSDQDLSIAIMNLISIEEHLMFSGAKTGKTYFYDLIVEIREMRKNLLKQIIKEYEGEVWCISKHLLAASMRLLEVWTKAQSMNKHTEAYEFFEKAYDLYSLFWGLQMGVVGSGDLRDLPEDDEKTFAGDLEKMVKPMEVASKKEAATKETISNGRGFMGKLGELVRKAVDCCIE